MSATNDSPEAPLERSVQGVPMRFDTAVVTLEGLLPAGFSGPVGKSVQDLFRPLEIVLEGGPYSILLGGVRTTVSPGISRALRIEETQALTVGGFVAAWLENFGSEPVPFRVRLRGHSGRRAPKEGPGNGEEVGSSSVWLGMMAGTPEATP